MTGVRPDSSSSWGLIGLRVQPGSDRTAHPAGPDSVAGRITIGTGDTEKENGGRGSIAHESLTARSSIYIYIYDHLRDRDLPHVTHARPPNFADLSPALIIGTADAGRNPTGNWQRYGGKRRLARP